MRGFVALPVVIILVMVGIVGVGWYTLSNRQQAKVEVSPSPSPYVSPTPSPTPTPTPKPTPKPTVKPTTKPIPIPSPSPSPTPVPEAPKTGCAEYNPGGDLESLKVTIQPETGKSLVGDAGVKIYRKYEECKGVDPGFPLTQIIKQGSTSTTFSGMRPGPFKIDVNYHGKTSTHDVGINSGENSITVTVSD
ncbi:MAG: hypothetical protein A3F31_03655 [Candidatus Levybacteria bacterium RIFCSPHIGHO2_12_FULL_38_12]|nr:MAG: hypothetical protein A3F31_03655 [Candidatus Levybacteria bacterium RIFCSPHIGHO2_12_FULL_38_12]OGH34431.1 MAG: hypothetical protein A3A47_02890 [Candidatus Levybacteria bacterium RIFCSPLOWO2_01_FULL_37_20]